MTPATSLTTMGDHQIAGLEATVRRLESEIALIRLQLARGGSPAGPGVATVPDSAAATLIDIKRRLGRLEGGAVAPSTSAPAAAPDRLALAVALAVAAIQLGVQAGDRRWHGGSADYEYEGQCYDAPGLIELARSRLES